MIKNRTFLLAALVSAGLLVAGTSQAGVSISVNLPGISVNLNDAPPPPREEVIPAPRPGWVWHPGYWNWNGHEHVWIGGSWAKERPGYIWVPERWEQRDGRWVMSPGRWDRHKGADWRDAQKAEFSRWNEWHDRDMRRDWKGPSGGDSHAAQAAHDNQDASPRSNRHDNGRADEGQHDNGRGKQDRHDDHRRDSRDDDNHDRR